MVVVLQDAPLFLKRRLALRLLEMRSGVYVSRCSGRVRDMIWRHVIDNIGTGHAVLAYRETSASALQLRHIRHGKPVGARPTGSLATVVRSGGSGRLATSA